MFKASEHQEHFQTPRPSKTTTTTTTTVEKH
jgi:hypothetical protein